jgi:uncharacterized protein YqfB (UPF0267 family)
MVPLGPVKVNRAALALALALGALNAGCRPAPRPSAGAPGARPSRPEPGARRSFDEAPGACDGLAVVRFAEHLCARVESGTKRITLRSRHRTEIRPGQWVQLVCMESRRRSLARVTGVRHTTWQGITERELRDDGFAGKQQMLEVMRGYYPGIGWDNRATVYRWEGAARCP